jgi:hypothetical protein
MVGLRESQSFDAASVSQDKDMKRVMLIGLDANRAP